MTACLPPPDLGWKMELDSLCTLAALGRPATSRDDSRTVSFALPRPLSPRYLWPPQVSTRQARFPTEEGHLQRVGCCVILARGVHGMWLCNYFCKRRFICKIAHLHLSLPLSHPLCITLNTVTYPCLFKLALLFLLALLPHTLYLYILEILFCYLNKHNHPLERRR